MPEEAKDTTKTPPKDIPAPDPNERVVETEQSQLSEMEKMLGTHHQPKPANNGGLDDNELEAALSTDEEPATPAPQEPATPAEPAATPPAEPKPQEPAAQPADEQKPAEQPQPEEPKLDTEQLGRLQRIINEQAEQIAQMREGKPAEQPQEQAAEAEQPAAQPVQVKEIATDEEIEEAMGDPAKFKELLQRAIVSTREAVMRDVLPIVDQATTRQISAKEAIKQFWTENKDLQGLQQYVNQMAYEVRAEHPEWTPTQILNETAQRARNNLGIQKQAAATEQSRKQQLEETEETKKPAFAKTPKGGGGRTPAGDGLSPEQKQMAAMLDATHQ